ALAAGLAQADIHMVRVADGTNRRPAVGTNAAHLAGGQRDLRPAGLAGGQGRTGAGAAANLATPARLQLQIVDRHAQWHFPQRHAVAHTRLDLLTADDFVAGPQPLRREDIVAHAILVLDQRDARRAIRIVLDAQDGGPDIVLDPLEVDDAVHPL